MPDDGRKRFHNWRIAAWNSFDNSVVHSLWKRLPTGENWNLAQYIGDTTMELYSLDINEIFPSFYIIIYYLYDRVKVDPSPINCLQGQGQTKPQAIDFGGLKQHVSVCLE